MIAFLIRIISVLKKADESVIIYFFNKASQLSPERTTLDFLYILTTSFTMIQARIYIG